jgi:DNA-binding Lrp family transcriptional regulator
MRSDTTDAPGPSAPSGPSGPSGPFAAYDGLDRRLVHALQIDARAPFSRIAEVLGVSDQTVARRYARLRSQGAVRVAGLPGRRPVDAAWWTVRLECAPGAAGELAEAVAHRPDTMWVSLLSGGAELAFALRDGEDENPLLERLPHSKRVVRMVAHQHLHTFFGGPLGLVNKSGALTAEEAERLRASRAPAAEPCGLPQPPVARPGREHGEAERRLIAALAHDGRATAAELARVTGWSASNVRRRVAELLASQALYFDVEYDYRLFSLAAHTAVWLSVRPSRLVAAGEALATHPEVAACIATTGPSNLFAVAVCTDITALYEYLTTRVAALPAVERMETAPVMRTVKGIVPGGPAARPPRR